MRYSHTLRHTTLALTLVLEPVLLTAQMPRERDIPLKPWAAPLYWQPTQEESKADVARLALTSPNPAAMTSLVLVAITPCRVIDTRSGSGFTGAFGPPSLVAGMSRTFPIPAGTCPIPEIALGYSFNVTVVPPGPLGFITVYPTGQSLPNSSTLNDTLGIVLANAAIVPAGNNGSVDVYASNATDLIIDVNGYYAPQGAIVNPVDGGGTTAVGVSALASNTTGFANTASGYQSLSNNTTGGDNTACGYQSLFSNTTGSNNTALGYDALFNTTGSSNIGIGSSAGNHSTTGTNNIMIGNQGLAADDHVIRIGDVQTQTFIAGITGVNVSGVPVLVSSSGQLGIASSSRRYKEDIQDMGEDSQGLLRLRPVTFRYKQPLADGSKPVQYGLIAEEVAEVYPDLVARSADGQIETVKYQVLDSMLLNEVQRQNAQLTAQKEEIRSLQDRLARLESMLDQTSTRTSLR